MEYNLNLKIRKHKRLSFSVTVGQFAGVVHNNSEHFPEWIWSDQNDVHYYYLDHDILDQFMLFFNVLEHFSF